MASVSAPDGRLTFLFVNLRGDPDNGAGSPGPRHRLDPGLADHRTVAHMMCDHQNKMTDIYDKFDHEPSETWKRS
jgi:hypothetical protein